MQIQYTLAISTSVWLLVLLTVLAGEKTLLLLPFQKPLLNAAHCNAAVARNLYIQLVMLYCRYSFSAKRQSDTLFLCVQIQCTLVTGRLVSSLMLLVFTVISSIHLHELMVYIRICCCATALHTGDTELLLSATDGRQRSNFKCHVSSHVIKQR
jgi:hypothetical protein